MADMQNLGTILKRLEAVTSRLEDISSSQASAAPTSSLRSPTSAAHEAVGGHVASASAAAAPSAGPGSAEQTPAVKAYQTDIIDGALADALAKSNELGATVAEMTALLEPLCAAQLAFLHLASQHQKPAAAGLAPLLGPQAQAIQAIQEAKDRLGKGKEGREWGNCLSVVSEGAGAWGWVQLDKGPAPFVEEMKNAAQFWTDRTTKQFKETNPAAVTWGKSVIALIEALRAHVKQHHTTGVTWSPNGPPAPASMPSSGSATSAPAPPSGAPPPPPPPPSSAAPSASTSAAPAAGGQAALIASLNRGGAVTSGLRKVDASQMTHKNPELRQSGVVVDKKEPPAVKPKPGAQAPKKPARFELEDGNKWIVEYQDGNKSISIDQTELSHTVQIFQCTNSVVRISGKINAVTMVGCKKTAIVLDTAVSSLSITSSPSFEVQITGTIPTIQVDTTDSGQIYLSQACMDTVEIITSKTSSLNISVPTGDQGDYEEKPVPEQLKSRVVGGKLVTEIVEHAG